MKGLWDIIKLRRHYLGYLDGPVVITGVLKREKQRIIVSSRSEDGSKRLEWCVKGAVCIQVASQFSSVQSLSHVPLFATPWITAARPPCPSPTPRVHSDSRPSSQWCHPAISSSVVPFSSCPQPLPASESFPMSRLFAWGGQSTGVSALASRSFKRWATDSHLSPGD